METEGRRQFRIGRCVGRGGFGEVYRATLRSAGGLETPVALKVLRRDLKPDVDAVVRLRDEGRVLARVTHPAIVRAHDLTQIDGRVALVTEYVEGEDLDRCFGPPSPIGAKALFEVVATLALALDAARTTPGADGRPLDIVHRDLKPTNVRLGRHGQVKLLDFGIARFSAADRESRTASDVVMGSLPYMAPERFIDRAVLPASDIFGLGCILFEGLAGARFHLEGKLRALSPMALERPRYDAHLAARMARVQASPELVAVVESCLRFDPTARPVAAELAARLDAIGEDLQGPTLRRYCADRAWPDAPSIKGELEGRTVTEGTLGLGPSAVEADLPSARKPVVVSRPLGTIDPSMFGEGETPREGMLPGRARPVAPSAFPSIPIGVALHELTGAAREVALSSTPSPPRSRPARAPEVLGPPEVLRPPPSRSRAPAVLAGVGCAGVVVLLALSVTFGAVAIAVLLAI